MNILAIESSCDETAAAVVSDGVRIVSNVVASSHEMHEKYGGIVPEVAARMQLESVIPVITEALMPLRGHPDEPMLQTIRHAIDAVAITVGPGLIGSLLVGVETAKTIALISGKPLIPVNHVLAHMYANFVDSRPVVFPAVSLVVSGGHTELYILKNHREITWLGGTLDDAAGECFDKTARLLGFGHGGGLSIQEAARKAVGGLMTTTLPRPMLDKHNEFNFSFSGLKTAILREVTSAKSKPGYDDGIINRLSREVEETITDVLVKKTLHAAERFSVRSILMSGGVSANLRLREKMEQAAGKRYPIHVPPVGLCTDNAVYIASYAHFRGKAEDWKTITAQPDLSVEAAD